jgi:hypothetical protein
MIFLAAAGLYCKWRPTEGMSQNGKGIGGGAEKRADIARGAAEDGKGYDRSGRIWFEPL